MSSATETIKEFEIVYRNLDTSVTLNAEVPPCLRPHHGDPREERSWSLLRAVDRRDASRVVRVGEQIDRRQLGPPPLHSVLLQMLREDQLQAPVRE